MIPQYINDWLEIIEDMSNDNTYKLVWGRAILECIVSKTYMENNNKVIISYDNISKCILKYYWNQLFYFNLKQAPYIDKEPIICKQVKQLIVEYKIITNSNIPEWFDRAEKDILDVNPNAYYQCISKISKTLHENVSYRFKNVNSKTLEIYDLDQDKSIVIFDKINVMDLEDYSYILSTLLNFKWAQLLEKFNYSPNISRKVKGISDAKLKRNNLTIFKEALLKEYENKEIIDFYTGKPISIKEVSIDHVIPWSFMYSDDIWNLVITSRSHNSSKSNNIPSKEDVEKLKQRNIQLEKLVDGKLKNELAEARINGYVDKFYLNFKL